MTRNFKKYGSNTYGVMTNFQHIEKKRTIKQIYFWHINFEVNDVIYFILFVIFCQSFEPKSLISPIWITHKQNQITDISIIR